MKTVRGDCNEDNFVVASPHAGLSSVANNTAHSIFLIIPSSRHHLASTSVAPTSSVCICCFCQRCLAWIQSLDSQGEGQSWFAGAINEISRWKSRMCSTTGQAAASALCPQETWTSLRRLRRGNDCSQVFYYDVWRTETRILECSFQSNSFVLE